MRINTRLLGEIDIDEAIVFTFPEGLLGLEGLRRFFLVEPAPGSPWKYLQSVEDGNVTFVVADPFVVCTSYVPRLPAVDLADIGLSEDSEAALLVIAVVPEDTRDTTVNLRAPLVFNPAAQLGRQVILEDDQYAVKNRVFPGEGSGDPALRPVAASSKRRPLAAAMLTAR